MVTRLAPCFIQCVHTRAHKHTLESQIHNVYAEMQGIKSSARWLMVDLGRVVFHSFTAEGRAYYDIEGQWEEAQHAYADRGWSYEQFLRSKEYNYRTGEK